MTCIARHWYDYRDNYHRARMQAGCAEMAVKRMRSMGFADAAKFHAAKAAQLRAAIAMPTDEAEAARNARWEALRFRLLAYFMARARALVTA